VAVVVLSGDGGMAGLGAIEEHLRRSLSPATVHHADHDQVQSILTPMSGSISGS
jgi:hypothetical protein